MKKFGFFLVLSLGLLIAILLWGNRFFTYCAFRFMGVEIVKIEYDIFDKLDAVISVRPDSLTYEIRIGAIRPNSFYKGGFIIKEINGYTLINYTCNDSSWRWNYCKEKGRYIATKGFSSSIIIINESVFFHIFNVRECNIPWILNNIRIIEAKLMAIPDDNYSYYRSPRGDEVYFKRVRRESGILDKLMKEVESNDTLFVFQNPDCNPKWMRKTE